MTSSRGNFDSGAANSTVEDVKSNEMSLDGSIWEDMMQTEPVSGQLAAVRVFVSPAKGIAQVLEHHRWHLIQWSVTLELWPCQLWQINSATLSAVSKTLKSCISNNMSLSFICDLLFFCIYIYWCVFQIQYGNQYSLGLITQNQHQYQSIFFIIRNSKITRQKWKTLKECCKVA